MVIIISFLQNLKKETEVGIEIETEAVGLL